MVKDNKKSVVKWVKERYSGKRVKLRVFSELGIILLLQSIGLWSIAEANGSWWAVMFPAFVIQKPVLYHLTNVMTFIILFVVLSDIVLMKMAKLQKNKLQNS